jgi:ribose transport system permease protein
MSPTESDSSVSATKPRMLRSFNEFSVIWFATALLFVVSAAIPGGLSGASLLSMLPFASILAIASIGQMFVIQQRGIDFSVVGVIGLSTVVISQYPSTHHNGLLVAILLVIAVGVLSGLVVGLAATKLRITPLIASLGVNALLLGAAEAYSGGTPSVAPAAMTRLANDKTIGIPNTLFLAVAVTAVLSFCLHRTTVGRRLKLIGANPDAANAQGLPVDVYRIGAYVMAGICYAAAGVVLAAYVSTPAIDSGDVYLLATISAVVIGGTPLVGGRASVLATAMGALFLSQLEQLVVALGAPTSVQLILQSAAIAVAMALRLVAARFPLNLAVRRRTAAA